MCYGMPTWCHQHDWIETIFEIISAYDLNSLSCSIFMMSLHLAFSKTETRGDKLTISFLFCPYKKHDCFRDYSDSQSCNSESKITSKAGQIAPPRASVENSNV